MKKLLVFLLLTVAALAGLAWWLSHRPGEKGVAFDTAAVEFGDLPETVGTTGFVQPVTTIAVTTEVPGRIVELTADFNQEVEEGQVLARLDDRNQRRNLERAEAAVGEALASVAKAQAGVEQAQGVLEAAQADVKEAERLKGLGGENKLPAARARVKTAEAAVKVAQGDLARAQESVRQARLAKKQAELALEQCVIRVPVVRHRGRQQDDIGSITLNGPAADRKRKYVVLDRKVRLNDLVGPPSNALLYTLAGDLSEVEVLTQVAEGDIARVSKGQQAEFTLADGERKYPAEVREVRMLPASDHGAIFYKVVLRARNVRDKSGSWVMRPGLTASADIIRRRHNGVWKMPNVALGFQLDEHYQTDAARKKLAEREARPDRDDWKVVWTLGGDGKPWPVFVRTGGVNARGETGIRDGQFTEVLELDPSLPAPSPQEPPKVIIGAPPVNKGFLSQPPNIKI